MSVQSESIGMAYEPDEPGLKEQFDDLFETEDFDHENVAETAPTCTATCPGLCETTELSLSESC